MGSISKNPDIIFFFKLMKCGRARTLKKPIPIRYATQSGKPYTVPAIEPAINKMGNR